MPIPEGRIVAAPDGGYVRNWDDRKSKFEAIVGRSVLEDQASTELVTPGAEHVLDRFHITMRVTVLSQYARGVVHHGKP